LFITFHSSFIRAGEPTGLLAAEEAAQYLRISLFTLRW